MTLNPFNIYRISPALWEEPRCYWKTGKIDEKTTLRELPSRFRQDWEWKFEPVPSTSYYRIKGSDGFLWLYGGGVGGKLVTVTPQAHVVHHFTVKQMGAYFTIALKQHPTELLECEDGNLGDSTQIRAAEAYSFPSDSWTEYSQIPSDAFRYLWKLDRADIDSKSWMNMLAKTKKLNELAICGTHDSCAWKWSSANFSRTQDLTILEQLRIGIRFVDIRLGPDFETYHGGKNDVSFEDVLKDIAGFLAESGSGHETIIMVIAGGDGLPSFATDLRDVMTGGTAGGKITTRLNWYYENRVPALSEVLGKVVLLRRFKDEQPNPPGIDLSMWGPVHSNDSFSATGIGGVTSIEVQDEYSLTQNSTKKGYIETLLPSMASPSLTNDHWYINFTSAAKLQKPSWYSNDINPWLGAQLNFHQFMRGTFVMDYPSAAIVDRIIQFNFQ